jgi:hypothetical protein
MKYMVKLNHKNLDLPEPHLTGLDQIDFTGLNFPKQNTNPSSGNGPSDAFPSDPWRNSTFNSIKSKKAPSAFNSISKKGGTSTLPRTLDLPLPAIEDDEIEVTVAPEMGGTFFKFINYQLVSKVNNIVRQKFQSNSFSRLESVQCFVDIATSTG